MFVRVRATRKNNKRPPAYDAPLFLVFNLPPIGGLRQFPRFFVTSAPSSSFPRSKLSSGPLFSPVARVHVSHVLFFGNFFPTLRLIFFKVKILFFSFIKLGPTYFLYCLLFPSNFIRASQTPEVVYSSYNFISFSLRACSYVTFTTAG